MLDAVRGADITRQAHRNPWAFPRVICALWATIALLIAAGPAAASVRPGSLDRGFGVHGRITRSVNPGLGNPLPVLKLAQAPSGAIYVLAGHNLLRYSPQGKLDRNFGSRGRLIVDESEGSRFAPAALAVDSRGRALVAGTSIQTLPVKHPGEEFIGTTTESATIFRYSPSGRPDSSFGMNGFVSSTLGVQPPINKSIEPGDLPEFDAPEVQVTGLTVDSEDRPVLTGTATTAIGSCRDVISAAFHESFVARFTALGEFDSTFSGSGVRLDEMETAAENPMIDPTGGVLYQRWVGPQCERDESDTIGVARLSPEGIADPAFGSDATGQFRTASAIAVDRIGGVLLLANGEGENEYSPNRLEGTLKPTRIMRLRLNGTLDPSFGRAGTQVLPQARGLDVNVIATDNQGRVLVAGSQESGGSFALLRLESNGKPDRTFGRNGKVVTGLHTETLPGPPMLIDRHDGVLVGAWANRSETRFSVSRYLP